MQLRDSILLILLFLGMLSCRRQEVMESEVLLKINDDELTIQEVVSKIPAGLHPADSVTMFNRIVDSWVKVRVLSGFAEERLYDLEGIDREVEAYRNKLIVSEYLRRMRENHTPIVEDANVKAYYDAHRKDLITELPLVKGVFLKVNASASGQDDIKKLMQSDSEESIDELERDWLDAALSYNYFRDKWVDWETVAGLIPYRFAEPDKFLEENKYFEITYGDCSYYLQITDYLPSGSEQPYEFASRWIHDLLTNGELADYERSLVSQLIKKSINENKLQMIGYDPIEHKLIEKDQ